LGQNTPHNFSSTQENAGDLQKTAVQSWDTGQQSIGVQSQAPKRGFLSPLVLGGIGLLVLFVLGIAGIGGAYMAGLFSGTPDNPGKNSATVSPTPAPSGSPVVTSTPDMVAIPGGTFVMGNNSGNDNEKPEHEETVQSFQMDRTEVTNGEYYEFVQATGYKEIPVHWENGKPLRGQEKMPVRYVNIDDVNAFVRWRSVRDGVTYRLPTEQEWEFAARNGNKKNLYPWGDKFEARCAVVNEERDDPKPVATATCPNEWGVQDLIGNVIEWTSSRAWLYPGSPGEVQQTGEVIYMVRGGSARYKSTGKDAISSTYRTFSPESMRHAALGFRLVRAN
jgi:formylglycine-generating enzyme required for sulfatase activity